MRVNIYIRKENEQRWLDIEDKSAWVNEKLNPSFKGISKTFDNDRVAIDAFNDKLTCKYGHPSKDGKSCTNIKCSYFNV